MKLHLPTALFALAVLPAVAFAEDRLINQDISSYDDITPDALEGAIHVVVPDAIAPNGAIKHDSDGVAIINGSLSLDGGTIKAESNKTKPAKLLYINGDLELKNGASAYLNYYTTPYGLEGIAARNVTVSNSNMELAAALFETLTVNSGSTVTLRHSHGTDNGGTLYGAGTDTRVGLNASLPGADYFEFSNVAITNGISVNGGSVTVGRGPRGEKSTYLGNFDSCYFQSTIGGKITQTGGSLYLQGQTYLYTSEISQSGGTMTIAKKHSFSNVDGKSGTFAEYLRVGQDKMTVTQGGNSDKTVLNLQGIIVKDASGDGTLQLEINQTGSGTINMETAKDSYRAKGAEKVTSHIGSYFTSEPGKESLISQSGSGQVNIGSDYQSATFNVEQKGEGSVTLKEHGVLRSSVVSINDKSTFKIDGGKLMLNEGAQLNLTVGTGSVGLQVANGGSITSASADSTVVVNVLLTEDAMKANITLDQLATLLDGTATSLTFSVDIAQFGTAADAEAFAGMLTMTGNEQVLTYTPDVATFSGEGAVPTDLAITVTGFTNAEGMVQAQVSAKRYTAPVPEPATATLSLLALAGLCARRRRK